MRRPADAVCGGAGMMDMIQIKDLRHVYGEGTPFASCALDGVSLSIKKGEFVGVIGHTGSGKSTLIQHLNGILKPTSGQIFFQGRDCLLYTSRCV